MQNGSMVEYVGGAVPALSGCVGKIVRTDRKGWIHVDFGGEHGERKCADVHLRPWPDPGEMPENKPASGKACATIVNVDLLISETGEGEIADAVSGILTEQMRCYAGRHSSLLDWRHTHQQQPVEIEQIDGEYLPDESASPWPASPPAQLPSPNAMDEHWFEALQSTRYGYWYVDRRTREGGDTIVDNLSEKFARMIADQLNAEIGRTVQYPDAMALLRDLVDWEAEAFDDDDEINGGDAVDFLAEFRLRAKALLGADNSPKNEGRHGLFIEETEHGEMTGKRQLPVELDESATGLRVIMGKHDQADAPDIMIELQADGWAVYVHDGANEEPQKIMLPVAKGEG